ncbi:PVC-type heme-binding CxxCH protein [Planctomicrobium sp. SH527]|uniref:PVC-type heme-binding CxxCH protein n=1 Tax=Planctomicrobium sp. SH527 TaxID=3448123 RepID=UPI003F5B1B81
MGRPAHPCRLSSLVVPLIVFQFLLNGFDSTANADPFSSAVRPTEALSPEEEQLALEVPSGFQIQLFASEPQIQKPINMAFDARGRMWVSGTQDYPFVNRDSPGDSIRILEDTDGDGKADRVTTFVDGITHPMGLLPYKDGVIAFCIPNIYFFRDTDGDGRCDSREFLFGPFDYSRDSHGLNNGFRLGFDGWIYACHGFNNHSVVRGPDGNVLDVNSGSIYRFRPDGSRIERYTYGQVNPFGMTFDKHGDLFSSDCHTKPLMLMFREGQYPSFGRQHDGLGFAPEVLTHSHGSTAIAGVAQASDPSFPEGFRDHFYVGNVMTSRVNRDSLVVSGSSVRAVEQPDFVISKDPWFRPVDIQLGPDGALYIADFYNRIIGHYEVALDHTGRDRHRGRIWRITYVGEKANSSSAQRSRTLNGVTDLTRADIDTLIDESQTANIPRKLQVITALMDRLQGNAKREAVSAIRLQLARSDLSDERRIALLWALYRAENLLEDDILDAANSSSELVRIHSQRILADDPKWSPTKRKAVITALDDSSQFVQRSAGDALARHPHPEHIQPLLKHWQSVPDSDPMLNYQLKLALRNQLTIPGTLTGLLKADLSEQDRKSLSTIAMGLNTPDSAAFFLEMDPETLFSQIPPEEVVNRIARWATPEQTGKLVQRIRSQWEDDPALQMQLLVKLQDGLRAQGVEPPPVVVNWARSLIHAMLVRYQDAPQWKIIATPPESPVTWDYEPRTSADGKTHFKMLSSLAGGEASVSKLVSSEFSLPAEFRFLICGHLGSPQSAPRPDNFARLVLVEGEQELARALPPRSDIPQEIVWKFADKIGQKVRFEVVDGLNLDSFAWIAVGGIDASILELPRTELVRDSRELKLALEQIRQLNQQEFEPQIIHLIQSGRYDFTVRALALQSLAGIQNDVIPVTLANICSLPVLTPTLRGKIEDAILSKSSGDQSELLKEFCKTLSTREQLLIAQAMLGQQGGTSLILNYCESGILSARILQSSAIRPQFENSKSIDEKTRFAELLKSVKPSNESIDQAISDLGQRLKQQQFDPAGGRKVFEAKCATCHQIQGVGKVIGPQLDGIGTRGTERLLEDILDPNRNIDEAFRSRTYVLEDGKIHTGVFRREDGALVVIANNSGNEVSFVKDHIEQQVSSKVSIMPDNWKEVLSDDEICSLLSYLLNQKNSR